MQPGAAFRRVAEIYSRQHMSIRTGLNPFHFDGQRDAAFTALFKDGHKADTGGGVSLQEYYFLECLFSAWSPKNVFIIGNAFGWSTLLIACLLPEARIVALDNGAEGAHGKDGINFTNALARFNNLNVQVIHGRSPDDVPQVVCAKLGGRIDFAFIDGLHTDEQQIADFSVCAPFMAEDHALLFHDVVNFGMTKSFAQIGSAMPHITRLLMRTPSGMGVQYTASLQEQIGPVVDMFSENEEICKSLWAETKAFRCPPIAAFPNHREM